VWLEAGRRRPRVGEAVSDAPSFPTTALVIGGSRGIGRALVHRLAARGTRCAIGYSARDSSAKQTAAEAGAVGPEPVLVKGDQGSGAARMVGDALDALGGLDALVTTAVPMITGRTLSVTRDEHRAAMDVQVWGFLEAFRAALPSLEAARGSAVSVSSLGAQLYARYYGALGPAKAALETLIKYLAAEVGPRGVRVNGVSPCLVDDIGHTGDAPDVMVLLDQVAKRTPMRRLAVPDEIASVIETLLGPEFAFVTGQIIAVDGGYSLLA